MQLQSCRQAVDSTHIQYIPTHMRSCEHRFDSTGYPSNHMKKKMVTKARHLQSPEKGIMTERLW